MTILVLLLCILGFALFGLASEGHHQRWLGRFPTARRKKRMRAAGWGALVGALPLAWAVAGGIVGPILWTGATMLGAAIVFLFLNLVPGRRQDPRRGHR
ncbi:DUF3325 domain-containing protein [Allosphingosinicella deserti]|uniref:DUF3325 domain-containing protein n=1 Tax=Allosphingosinicella deserti TaxID=2116704 RepID=A0A2P7QSJ1_9SPHN|nr:DUF3325 domain-containing protein [Sphingomonas deserti]PSJ40948.1 DUF3325 domain-containing protein [Sphingomonas deserti]